MSEATEHRARAITLGIGSVRVRFESAEPDLVMQVDFPRTRFVVTDELVDTVIRVRLGDPHPGDADPWFNVGGVWRLHRREQGGERVSFWGAVVDEQLQPMIRIDLDRNLSIGEMTVAPSGARGGVLRIGFPVDEWLIGRLLARRDQFILHASAIEMNRAAYVFAGHSGAGKSTIAAIAEECGARVLSDDRTVLSMSGDIAVAAGTPWHGSHASGSADVLPVGGVFLLEQASKDEAVPLPILQAFAELMVRTIRPTAEFAEHEAVVNTVERVAHSVRAARLRFRPTPAALDAARAFVAD